MKFVPVRKVEMKPQENSCVDMVSKICTLDVGQLNASLIRRGVSGQDIASAGVYSTAPLDSESVQGMVKCRVVRVSTLTLTTSDNINSVNYELVLL